MSLEACRECRFWERLSRDQGGCRRFPPQVTVTMFKDGYGEQKKDFDSTYPQTCGDDWCGEFEEHK